MKYASGNKSLPAPKQTDLIPSEHNTSDPPPPGPFLSIVKDYCDEQQARTTDKVLKQSHELLQDNETENTNTLISVVEKRTPSSQSRLRKSFVYKDNAFNAVNRLTIAQSNKTMFETFHQNSVGEENNGSLLQKNRQDSKQTEYKLSQRRNGSLKGMKQEVDPIRSRKINKWHGFSAKETEAVDFYPQNSRSEYEKAIRGSLPYGDASFRSKRSDHDVEYDDPYREVTNRIPEESSELRFGVRRNTTHQEQTDSVDTGYIDGFTGTQKISKRPTKGME